MESTSQWHFSFVRLRQIKYAETPIKVYSKIHTGPNTQLGGLNAGFIKLTYHVGIAGTVKKEPTTPTTKTKSDAIKPIKKVAKKKKVSHETPNGKTA